MGLLASVNVSVEAAQTPTPQQQLCMAFENLAQPLTPRQAVVYRLNCINNSKQPPAQQTTHSLTPQPTTGSGSQQQSEAVGRLQNLVSQVRSYSAQRFELLAAPPPEPQPNTNTQPPSDTSTVASNPATTNSSQQSIPPPVNSPAGTGSGETNTQRIEALVDDLNKQFQAQSQLNAANDATNNQKSIQANATSLANTALRQSRQMCVYRQNVMTFLAGISSLARAPKIVDNVKLLNLAGPIPFSKCDQSIDSNVAPLIVPTPVSVTVGDSDGTQVKIIESGYTGRFSLTPADSSLLTVLPYRAANAKMDARDTFLFKSPVSKSAATSVTVMDELGQKQTIYVALVAPK